LFTNQEGKKCILLPIVINVVVLFGSLNGDDTQEERKDDCRKYTSSSKKLEKIFLPRVNKKI
jgi:hypothetical protein